MSIVEPIIEPDPEQMRRHVGHLFEDCHEGRVELAWTDGGHGRLCHAAIFGTHELDDLVERAVVESRKPRQNVYIGQALRKPDVPSFGRCKDADFLALTALYVDIDDDVTATAATSYRNRGCPPTAVVITGRHPHKRAQMLWRLESPERDPALCRQQNQALAAALGGDSTVVNPSRVMRLGGSIAWPIKPGRVIERTEFVTFSDDRPRQYPGVEIARAFPTLQASLEQETGPPSTASAQSAKEQTASAAPPADATPPDIDSPHVSVEACLALIRAGNHWHDNLIRLTGHWIARGWSDAEILTAAEALTLPGYTVEQTRRDVATMIAGGRRKWAIPDSVHELDGAKPLPALVPAWVEDLNAATIPRRRYLLGRMLVRGHVTVRVSPPGAGKSTLAIEEGVAVVTGREITGLAVHEQTKVWIYNNEDDGDEMRRRLAAVLAHWSVSFDAVRGRLALNSGADRPLLVAKADRLGNVIRQPDVGACIEHIRANGIGLFVVDPFVETHEVGENANDQIKTVAAMFREIARRGECAVLLLHHTAKPPQGSSDGHAGNMHTARGASALVGVARVVQTLFNMGARDAERFGIPDHERHLYVRLDDAKANLSLADGKPRWFQRASTIIANGEEVGVLVPADLASAAASEAGTADFHRDLIGALLALTRDDELSVNAAARALAWSSDARFTAYRQTDAQGHRRVKRVLRDAVRAASKAKTEVVSGDLAAGFSCDESGKRSVLRRFERAVSPADLASPIPDFAEESP